MYAIFSKIMFIIFALIILFIIYKYYKSNKKEVGKFFSNIINYLNGLIESKYKIIFAIILFIFLVTRLYALDQVPQGVHIDEAATAYNAINIAKYGVDRYLNPFPVYFLNFGGGQSAMYTYLGAILVKLFGYSLFLIRIPAVFFGLLTLIFGYFLGKEMAGRKFGLLVALLITICPYFVMASRFGLDCNLMLGLFTVSLYVLLKAIKTEKLKYFVFSGILFGLTLYTYALSYLIIPLVLIGILIYLIYLKRVNYKQIISVFIPLLVLAIPLILNVMVNMELIPEIKTSFFTIPKMVNNRVSEISFANVFTNIKGMGNYLTHDPLIYNAFPRFGTLYLFSIPIVLFGILVAFMKSVHFFKEKSLVIILIY